MARMTIYVADDLKARIDANKDSVNWSEVACRAFEIKLGELAAARKEKSMNDVVERLRASKLKFEDQHHARGRARGEWWATERAEFDQLERLANYDMESYGEGIPSAPLNAAGWLAREILGGMEAEPEDAEQFWELMADEPADTENEAFVRGFVAGALGVFERVQDQI